MNRLMLVLVSLAWLLVGCGGSAFTAGELTETDATDAGAGSETSTSSPEASREAGDGQAAMTNDADAGPAPEEAGTTSSSGSSSSSSSSGSSSGGSTSSSSSSGGSSSSSSGTVGPCDGGPAVVHHVGVAGLTWSDCVPLGTFTGVQARQACQTWCAAQPGGCLGMCQQEAICGNVGAYDMVGQVGQPATASMGWSWFAPTAGSVTNVLTCGSAGTWN